MGPENRSDPRPKYEALVNGLMRTAFERSGFDALCSLLRVGGMADASWDPFEESRAAFEDYNWLLNKARSERGRRAERRVALLIYCQAVEMNAPHEVLANLLRSVAGKRYSTIPFADLGRRKKSDPLAFTPPSAAAKFRRIGALAEEAGFPDIKKAVEDVFEDRLRNAFSHSDYVLTDTAFRFSEGLTDQEMKAETLDRKLNECFGFYSSLLLVQHRWLHVAAQQKRFHKLPNYEVMELLRSDEEGAYGFRLHFSNGTAAWYTRRSSGIDAVNISFDDEGHLAFHVGDLDALKTVWMIEGRPVHDWESLP